MMTKTKEQLMARQREIQSNLSAIVDASKDREMTAEETANVQNLKREFELNRNQLSMDIQEAQLRSLEKPVQKDANTLLREYIQDVRMHKVDGEVMLKRSDSQNTITSSIIASGDVNNMTSASIPLTIKDLLNPLEMGTVYDKVGLQIATGVRGAIQWPHLDTAAEVSVGGELDDAETKTLDFSKISATPYKLGIKIGVSNEAINDESFDLVGTIIAQMNKAVGRVLNQRVLALTAPSTKAAFRGPFVGIASAQQVTFATAGAPTYKEIKSLKAKVLATGAEMSGFCYVMDAAMYSYLETTSKDTGSGIFVIQDGKIDGDPVFITSLSAYSGKVAAGCFGYVALNQHGPTYFVTDIYTGAAKNVTYFVLNADWSISVLESTPFAVGAGA